MPPEESIRLIAQSGEGCSDATACDPDWDGFLEGNPLGQFQQTSRWGRVKAREGWNVSRVRLRSERDLEGGFQLLWKRSRFGRLGYVSKGPVLREERPELIDAAWHEMVALGKRLRLTALIAQPPDFSRLNDVDLERYGFSGAVVPAVIDATLLVDVSDGREAILGRMSQTMRNSVRQSLRKGVAISQAGKAGLAQFFQLMLETCRRQQTEPNPSRLESLEALWDEFEPRVRLTFASVSGEVVAGALLIGFGQRLTIWKKGWNVHESKVHPNALLYADALWWANENGYRQFDVVSVDREIATCLLAGQQLTEQQLRSRHMFHLRLGGQPHLLPRAQILVVNPLQRALFGALVRWKTLRNILFQVVRVG